MRNQESALAVSDSINLPVFFRRDILDRDMPTECIGIYRKCGFSVVHIDNESRGELEFSQQQILWYSGMHALNMGDNCRFFHFRGGNYREVTWRESLGLLRVSPAQ